MKKSALVTHVYTGDNHWSTFHTVKGLVETSLPFLADMASLMDLERVKSLIFVPHCLARKRELRDLNGLVERARDEIRSILRASRLNGEPLDRMYRERYGRSPMADIKVIPLECLGKWEVDGEVVDFRGDLLWMTLRMMLHMEDGLEDLTTDRLLLVDLSGGGMYHAPVYAASSLVNASHRDVTVGYTYWEGSSWWERSRLEERRVIGGAEELLTVTNLLTSLLRGCPEDPMRILPDLITRLRKGTLGEMVADGLLSMVGVVCGFKLPLLPMAHLSILDLVELDVPRIREPMDLEMRVELLRYDLWTVKYIYRSSGMEIDDPLVALMLVAISFSKDALHEMGIVPSLERFEVVDPKSGRRLLLLDMSWEWIRLVTDFLLENRAISQLYTICIHFGPMLDVCSEMLGLRASAGMRYDDLWVMAREEGVSLLSDLLERRKQRKDLPPAEGEEESEYGDDLLKKVYLLISTAGLTSPLVHLVHAHEKGMEFLYVEDLIRKLRDPSILIRLCSGG